MHRNSRSLASVLSLETNSGLMLIATASGPASSPKVPHPVATDTPPSQSPQPSPPPALCPPSSTASLSWSGMILSPDAASTTVAAAAAALASSTAGGADLPGVTAASEAKRLVSRMVYMPQSKSLICWGASRTCSTHDEPSPPTAVVEAAYRDASAIGVVGWFREVPQREVLRTTRKLKPPFSSPSPCLPAGAYTRG